MLHATLYIMTPACEISNVKPYSNANRRLFNETTISTPQAKMTTLSESTERRMAIELCVQLGMTPTQAYENLK